MGYFSDYLKAGLNQQQLERERKAQLAKIAAIRGRDVLVFAADASKGRLPISIEFRDLTPINDQLSNLSHADIDLILETPGGSGETAEDIVKLLRGKFSKVGVIVPGMAKSAGTLIAMAADEILMEPVSALGPIDAQLLWQGKVFSAGALIEGVEKIKKEVLTDGFLNKAYIPILQSVSPGELQNAENALDFSQLLVREWLVKYKFKDWSTHRSTGKPVTEDERRIRAAEIASALCDHKHWKTHGRSIHIEELRRMRLEITDYSLDPALREPIQRYQALLQLTFEGNIYKLFETPTSLILRADGGQRPGPPSGPRVAGGNLPKVQTAEADLGCGNCGTKIAVVARFSKDTPVPAGRIAWPQGDTLQCPKCKANIDLRVARQQIEQQVGMPIV